MVLEPDGKWQGFTWAEPGTEEYFTNRDGFWGGTPIIFGRSLFETIAGGRLVVAVNDSFVLRQMNTDGSIQRKVALDWTPVPVSGGWMEEKRQQLLDSLADSGSSLGVPAQFLDPSTQDKLHRWLQERNRNLPRRDSLPAFWDLRGDATGSLWIAEYSAPVGNDQRWIVVDSAFEPVARMTMPRGLEVLDIGRNSVLIKKTDDLGRESIAVYRIIRTKTSPVPTRFP
jgi:hypothetical protein